MVFAAPARKVTTQAAPVAMRNRKLWLCLPPTVLFLIDHTATMWFQPAQYWGGNFAEAQESSPPYLWLLQQHPLAGGAGAVGYVLVFWSLIVMLPWRLALLCSLALTLGHTWGAGTWITYHIDPGGYWLTIGLCLVAACLVIFAGERAGVIRYRQDPIPDNPDLSMPP
jgi:hypothetical protein